MGTEWEVRAATRDDLPALTMLSAANRIYHAEVAGFAEASDLATRRARYEALLAADNALVLLAEVGATPIACFAAIFYPPGRDVPARAYIEDVFVSQRWRRQGVLGAMLEPFLDACVARRIERVDVDYLADNPAGAAAWTRLGFAPRSVRAGATVAGLRERRRR
jgi:GNAT superfamily N-acetyltransferase